MDNLLKILSYIFPVSVARVNGEVTHSLEVRLENGKYVLNAATVNYSHGGLYKIFKKVFRKYYLSNRTIDKVLILGFGAGSAALLLRKEHAITATISGVEHDRAVIGLAKKYFVLEQYNPLELIHCDAFEFVMNCRETYDIIIMDVFIEDETPAKFLREKFIQRLGKLLSSDGILFYNKMVHTPQHKNFFKYFV